MQKTLILSFFFLNLLSYSQENCCDQDACKIKAAEIAGSFTSSLSVLGPCPIEKTDAQKKLKELQNSNPDAYSRISKTKQKYLSYTKTNSDIKNCVLSFIGDINVLDWVSLLFIDDESVPPSSPEFCKGFGLQYDINFGSRNPYSDKEIFAQSMHLLFGYTFAKKGCGGTTRIMLGPSFHHFSREDYLMGTARLEIRLKDISTMVGSIANFKLIVQGAANEHGFIAGIGAGLEIGKKATIQLLPQFIRVNNTNSHSYQLGFGYRFFK